MSHDLLSVGLHAVYQRVRVAECRKVTAVDLVGRNPEAFLHHPAQEVGREKPILTAQDKSGGNVRPLLEWPGFFHRRAGLLLLPASERLRGDVGRDVVKKDLLGVEGSV